MIVFWEKRRFSRTSQFKKFEKKVKIREDVCVINKVSTFFKAFGGQIDSKNGYFTSGSTSLAHVRMTAKSILLFGGPHQDLPVRGSSLIQFINRISVILSDVVRNLPKLSETNQNGSNLSNSADNCPTLPVTARSGSKYLMNRPKMFKID
ncbi:unnamed protein product [Nesidiocoris tenuis]|uniref:Uncharacterized protein n=1 Tax=Nesidiocoris tenuis TaxID=355587 RepID=A0A6H5GNV3_9HEMI|nr:unnamed protein product [Nesidiocoris tenuis]